MDTKNRNETLEMLELPIWSALSLSRAPRQAGEVLVLRKIQGVSDVVSGCDEA